MLLPVWVSVNQSRWSWVRIGSPVQLLQNLIEPRLVQRHDFGIRSERRLCQEVHLNLAYRWFL
jgi:hypothetical protein